MHRIIFTQYPLAKETPEGVEAQCLKPTLTVCNDVRRFSMYSYCAIISGSTIQFEPGTEVNITLAPFYNPGLYQVLGPFPPLNCFKTYIPSVSMGIWKSEILFLLEKRQEESNFFI